MTLAVSVQQAQTYRVVIDEIRDETPTVKTFRLRFPAGTDFTFLPGQWAMFHFPDDPKNSRVYSFASSPSERDYIEISLGKVESFTERLFRLRAGDLLILKGPYGKWVYTDDISHAVLISGGTGVTPFRSIARYVVQKKLPNRLTILSSSRTPEDILYRAELDEYAKLPNIKVVHAVTRPQGVRWEGLTGRLDINKIKASVPDFKEADYYLCGPNQLVRTISAELDSQGVRKERVHHEMWGDFKPD